MSIETIHRLMTEIGPLLDLAEVVSFPEQCLWTLTLDNGAVVECELEASGERLLCSMEAGELVDEADMRLMLQYNLLWSQTGGMHFALAGGTAMLLRELPSAALDLPTLSAAVVDLQEQASVWRQIFSAAPLLHFSTGALQDFAHRA